MVVMFIPTGQKNNLHSLLNLDLLYALHIKEMVRKVTINLKTLQFFLCWWHLKWIMESSHNVVFYFIC